MSLVAGGVVLLSLATIAFAQPWLLAVAATLESVFGLCLGCRAFALLMRAGVIPPEVCERCNGVAGELPGRA
jgi:hypothetical protein